MCEKKAHGGKKLWSQFLVCVKISRRQGSCKKQHSTKTLTMTLIDIDDLLSKDLDLTTLDRDASYAPPASENQNGGNVTDQAACDSLSRNTPPRQVQSVTTAEADLVRLTRDTSTVLSAFQPPNGGATMVQMDQTSPSINSPPLLGCNFVTAYAIGET